MKALLLVKAKAMFTGLWCLVLVTFFYHVSNLNVVVFKSPFLVQRIVVANKANIAEEKVKVRSHFEAIFEHRRNVAAQGCRKHFGFDATTSEQPEVNENTTFKKPRLWSRNFLDFTFFDDRYKILVCTIPKVASTNIKEMLLDFLDRHLATWPPFHRGAKLLPHIHRLLELPRPINIKDRMNYTKIIVVRHPLDRLISAWRNKFSKGIPRENWYLRPHAQRILTKYRKQSPEQPVIYTGYEPVELQEFFEYLRNEGTMPNFTDVHWRSYVDNCDPCRISYDYIAHFENLAEELNYIVNVTTGRNITTALPTPAPDSFAGHFRQSAISTMKQNSSSLEEIASNNNLTLRSFYANKLPLELVKDVATLYTKDFEIFGYESI